ncbi:MAG TPA: hypothetical protein VM031_02310 [Phycisphaerae bacterium]|nr:hypothetical protein [Phycisphaerae bacterium]
MQELLSVLAVAAIGALVVFLGTWHFRRSRRLVDDWARANQLDLLSADRRFFRLGPFWWRTARNQEVFRVTVRDADGQIRHGYVRVGGWFMGMLSGKVTAQWD